jgi:hypothetical protein
MLVTNRSRGFPTQDHDPEDEASQGALFAPESLAPTSHPVRHPGPTPDPFAPPARPSTSEEAAASDDSEGPNALVSPPADTDTDALVSPAAPAADELVAPPEYAADPDASALVQPTPDDAETAPARDLTTRRRAIPLAGPTLDDVVSRVWEGLRAEVATPCPICRTEIEASMHGRCGTCGSTLD